MSTHRLPTIFVPHGGGPCFFMDWKMGPANTWDALAAHLRQLPAMLATRPLSIVVVSGHHEGKVVEITSGANPAMLFDYYGFPEHTYRLNYPAPGSPELAERIGTLLDDGVVDHRFDPTRGFDHGVFIPLLLMFPDADIPVVQVSLRSDLNAEFHLRLGEQLAPLRDQGVLIIGSGMSYHNMHAFTSQTGGSDSRAFDDWLITTCTAEPGQRRRALAHWHEAPAARRAHPREEHLLPLMVVAGASGVDVGIRTFSGNVMGAAVSGFGFGLPARPAASPNLITASLP